MTDFVAIANNSEIHIRLLQWKPAWAIHCLLRFRNLPYLSENTGSRSALGFHAPVIVDGNYIFGERLAIEHICTNRVTKNTARDQTSELIDTNNSKSQILAADNTLFHHIQVAVNAVYEQLESLEQSNENHMFGLSIPTKVIGKLLSLFKIFDVSSDKPE
jgi:hypothetical protein